MPLKEAFPTNRYRIVFYPPEGGREQRLDSRDDGLALSDMVFSLKLRLFSGNDFLPALLLGGNLKIPTGTMEGGGVDFGGGLYLTKRIWRLYGYFGVDYLRCSKEEILGVHMNPDQWRFLLGLEYPFGDRFSVIIQHLMHTSVASDFYQFSEHTYGIALGVKCRIFSRTLLEFGMLENVIEHDNTPDVGVHFGLRHRFN